MKELNLQQDSQEWLDKRRDCIGASDAPIIMGKSIWTTPYVLWKRKLGLEPEQKLNDAMLEGKYKESSARIEFVRQTGIEVFPKVFIHDNLNWMMASLDGISKDGRIAVEIKCPKNGRLYDEVPEIYMPQLQHQMEVCNLDKIYLFSFNGTNGKMLLVNRDQEFITDMIEKETRFYECMICLESPSISKNDYIVRNDLDWNFFSEEYKKKKKEMEILEIEVDSVKESLVKLSSNENCCGSGIKVSKIYRKGNIDYRLIPELKNVDLENYRKAIIQSWRITEYEKGIDS